MLCSCLLLGPPSKTWRLKTAPPAASPLLQGPGRVHTGSCLSPCQPSGEAVGGERVPFQQGFICPFSFLVLRGEKPFVHLATATQYTRGHRPALANNRQGRGLAACCEMEPTSVKAVRLKVWAGPGGSGPFAMDLPLPCPSQAPMGIRPPCCAVMAGQVAGSI